MTLPERQARLRAAVDIDPDGFEVPNLDGDDVPLALQHLIPLAEQWGIGDDGYRSLAVEGSSDEDLGRLAAAIPPQVDRLFDDWLAGPEAEGPGWSDAYIAFSNLRIAADEALSEVERRAAETLG